MDWLSEIDQQPSDEEVSKRWEAWSWEEWGEWMNEWEREKKVQDDRGKVIIIIIIHD